MKITYYRDPFGGYHGVTDESPKGLAGCICAGRGPDEHGSVEPVKLKFTPGKDIIPEEYTSAPEVSGPAL